MGDHQIFLIVSATFLAADFMRFPLKLVFRERVAGPQHNPTSGNVKRCIKRRAKLSTIVSSLLATLLASSVRFQASFPVWGSSQPSVRLKTILGPGCRYQGDLMKAPCWISDWHWPAGRELHLTEAVILFIPKDYLVSWHHRHKPPPGINNGASLIPACTYRLVTLAIEDTIQNNDSDGLDVFSGWRMLTD